jgi:RNA polymerase sigma factor (sigma-70 family)
MTKNPYTKKEQSLKYKSFAKAYKEVALPLMKFLIKRSGGDVEAAEEVFSRTIEASLKGYYTFENKSKFFTWVCKIGLNKMADYYRDVINQRSRIMAPLFEELAQISDSSLTPEEDLTLRELKEGVKECLELLPEETKYLLHLRYYEDLSVKGIALRLNISEKAAEGRLYRAKHELKEIVIQRYPNLY